MNKLDALKAMMTPDQKQAILGLQNAINEYNKASNDQTYGKVLFELFTAAKQSVYVFFPIESYDKEQEGFVPGKVTTTGGQAYVICTSPEEAALCPEDKMATIGADHIISAAADDPYCNGVCINPYGSHPCFLPRDYIRRILSL